MEKMSIVGHINFDAVCTRDRNTQYFDLKFCFALLNRGIASICQAELKINENFYEDKYKLYLIF
ncbi:hypothetical protein Avbf_14906 [Armadillidium vulgare]|nr:hypothetical protein Avbf_14906 [Armadillidium vulgare]